MNELVVAVVPIRSFRNGKTRLSEVLTADERADFLRESARIVIDAALDSRVVDTVLVVSPDPDVLNWVAGMERRVHGLSQLVDRPGLNAAMDAARDWAIERDADRLLSLFADLPRLTIFDIRRMVARRCDVVLGPDRRGEGTNAMLLRLQGPGAEFQFAFGEGSLALHRQEARRLGLSMAIEQTPGIGFDLDTPDDWDDFLERDAEPAAGSQWQVALVGCGAGCR